MSIDGTSTQTFFGRSKRFLVATLVLLLLGGFVLRLLDLKDPPLDFQPARQLRDALVARGMYYQMMPSADPNLRQIAISLWKSQNVYEPPIFERLVALTYLLAGGEYLWIARIYSALFWCIGGFFLYLLARRISTVDGGVIALAYYLFLPFGAIASRSFQPDPLMVMWMLIAVFTLYRWVETGLWKWAILAGIFSGVAILFKTTAAFPILGVFCALLLICKGIKAFWQRQTWVVGALFVIIPAAYYLFGIGQRSSGFFEFWTLSFIKLLKQPWFYLRWLGLLDSVVGLSVFFVSLAGVLLLPKQGRALAIGLWLGYVVYGFTLPYQIYTHDYYSLPLIPIVALSLAGIAELVLNRLALQSKFWQGLFMIIASFTLIYYAWSIRTELFSKSYRGEPNGWREIGDLLPKDGAIIALTQDYGHRLEYYGWTQFYIWPYRADFDLEALRSNGDVLNFEKYFAKKIAGKKYFLVTTMGEFDGQPLLKTMLLEHYPVFQQGKSWTIYDLSHEK